ncbi:hypothetical protein PHET_11738 [Paragonimus heterotremus]|uniref:WW domain-containing protein n=1 Tax=Paragonimus heterotremus TaxID=100268 RepID=A0A8J4SJA7_9TREM|nr:hypothetical protein PHET_11738 [Paragonimus heterotremus]
MEDYSSHSADSVTQKTKKMGAARGRFEKNAIRVSGDWSEQLSSKGKIYFYNCITEVSQWQKPPDWKLPDMDHEELLRRLGSREQVTVDGKSTKRLHVTSSVNVGGVRDSVYGSCLSPKRGKYTSEVRRVNQAAGNKFSPALMDSSVTRVNCLTELTPRSFNHRSRPISRSSPKRHYDHRGSQAFGLTAQSRRHLTNNLSVPPCPVEARHLTRWQTANLRNRLSVFGTIHTISMFLRDLRVVPQKRRT